MKFIKMNVVQHFLCCYCLVKYCYYCKVSRLTLVHSTPFRSVAAFFCWDLFKIP